MSDTMIDFIKKVKVVPVAVFDKVEDCLRTAELLLENSFNVLEITLRTESAIKCIEAAVKKFPEMKIGAGSILGLSSLDSARDAGALFGVSPSLDMEIVERAVSLQFPYVPGVATPSEINMALKKCSVIKIFPASQLGGTEYLKAALAPFKMKKFGVIPTGGINEKNYSDYIKTEGVIACGMTYMVDKKLIDAGDFSTLEKRIKEIASGLL